MIRSPKLLWVESLLEQHRALRGVTGTPGVLLRASSTPAGQLCSSSSLWVWPGQLCVGLGFQLAAESAPAPSGSTVHAAGACGPLPGSSGSTVQADQLRCCGIAQASPGPILYRWRMDLLRVPSGASTPYVRCHSPTTGPVCQGLHHLEE